MKTQNFFSVVILMYCLSLYSINVFGQCATPPADMVSWWQAENNANDLYGNNSGMEQNGISYVSGVVNIAFQFDGIDDVVVVPHSADLDLSGDVTVELWVRQTGFDNEIQTVICKGAGDVPNNEPAVFLMRFENATAKFLFKDSTGVYIEKLGPTFEDWQWHHYAYVRQGNMHILYADGFEFGWESFTDSPESSVGLPLTIGAQYHNPTSSVNDYSSFFAGEVDEVGVYNRALSEAEIQGIYNAGALGKCSDGLSINDFSLVEKITPFPNPAMNTVTFKIDEQFLNTHQDLKLSILDVTGRVVISNLELHTETNIDVSMLVNGMYLYTISSQNSILKSGQILKK